MRASALNQSWEQFTDGLPTTGPEGLETLTLESAGIRIDAIVYRAFGRIAGVLYHYPDGTPFEKPGQANLMVDPRRRREGIGTLLTDAAIRQFGLQLDKQTYTDAGAALRASLMKGERDDSNV